MTGYGASRIENNHRYLEFSIRSLNHRFSNFSFRLPRALQPLESKIKNFIQQYVQRGRIEVNAELQVRDVGEDMVCLNLPLAEQYYERLKDLKVKFDFKDTIVLRSLTTFQDIFQVKEPEIDMDELWKDVKKALSEALKMLNEAREKEGAAIEADVKKRMKLLQGFTDEIDQESQTVIDETRKKLKEKISRILEEGEPDPYRLEQEIAFLAARSDITEELTRIRSHFDQLYGFLEEKEEAAGRKIDFLIQELQREINTIGSKAGGKSLIRNVVLFKGELEKIREQIQNVE